MYDTSVIMISPDGTQTRDGLRRQSI